MKYKELVTWSKNISYNYKHDIDTNIISQLIDCSISLKLNFEEIDKRYRYATDSDFKNYKMIYFILTGDLSKYGLGFN